MKKLNTFIIGLILILTGSACDSAKNPHHSPKSITKAYAESLYTGHFDEVKNYVTEESIPIINFFQHAFPPEHFEGCDHITMEEITVKNTTDSTAICKCIIHFCSGKSGNEVTKVVKRDGKWYVTLRQGAEEKKKAEEEQMVIVNN